MINNGLRRDNLRKENCRFVLQRCEVCGAEFPMIYWFDDQKMTSFGFSCKHVPVDGAGFYPVDGQPTFREWYTAQLYIRGLLTGYLSQN